MIHPLLLIASAQAQNVEVFAGLELLVRTSRRPELGIGLEATGTVYGYGLEAGAFGQVQLLGRSGLELAAGGTGGVVLAGFVDGPGYIPMIGANAEVGPAWSLRSGPGLRVGGELRGIVLELGVSSVRWSSASAGAVPSWAPATVSFGLQVPLVPAWVVGRPLRIAGGRLVPGLRAAAGARLDPAARHWLEQARDELASVGAFARLARELAHLGAPRELVRRARVAASEERGHAASCLRVARRHAGARVGLGPLPLVPSRPPSLQTVADEAWHDGWLNEGAAAEAAAADAARSHDAEARATLERISGEEREHARLGLDVVRWCEGRGVTPRFTC